VDNVHARHQEMARMTRQAVSELGMSLQCPALDGHSPTLTAIRAPERISPAVIRERLKERGILVARALGRFEPTCFRIGHMGDIRPADVRRTLGALAEVVGAGQQ